MIFYFEGSVTSGFEVFFAPHPADQFTDWPQLVHLYGSKALGSGQEVLLEKDLESISVCGDSASGFLSLRFLEIGETIPKEVGPTCTDWIDFALKSERVVGFAVTTSDYDNGGETITNIRAIAPMVDCPDCEYTTPIIDTATLKVTIGPGSESATKVTDLMSLAYFLEDGTSFCADEYTVTVTSPETLPSWISFSGGVFTVTSDS